MLQNLYAYCPTISGSHTCCRRLTFAGQAAGSAVGAVGVYNIADGHLARCCTGCNIRLKHGSLARLEVADALAVAITLSVPT